MGKQKNNQCVVLLHSMGRTWRFGTNTNSVPNQLKPIDYETFIITGNKSSNPLFSSWMNGEDNGKVSVNSAKLDEMKDFPVVPTGHAFIMNNMQVIKQTLNFPERGHKL